jgi:hypothetical protein
VFIFTHPKNTVDAFAKHFKSISNTSCLNAATPYSVTTDFLPTAPISDADVSKTIKHMKPFKCVVLNGIPSLRVVLISLFHC